MTKLIFHRDKYGAHIYYPGMNEYVPDLVMLNGEEFRTKYISIVPPVESLTSDLSGDKIEFEIIDIDYCADDRMTPMRHFNTKRINYFEVSGVDVAKKFIHSLCKSEGLEESVTDRRNTFEVRDRWSEISMKIEGKIYNENINKVSLRDFQGLRQECQEYINQIESAIRKDFDIWKINDKSPSELTVGFVVTELNKIRNQVSRIDSKLKTKEVYKRALAMIDIMIEESRLFAMKELDKDGD
jgi:hypothetical protein